MRDDDSVSDDPGTILHSFASFPHAIPRGVAAPAAKPVPAEEQLYRSPFSWRAPRILICDEGSLDEGEIFHVRTERVQIGRTTGDLVIGHNIAMSSSHAEVARRDAGGKQAWVLRDLDSANGTFARVRSLTLRPGMLIQLGSKRYRFDLPGSRHSATDRFTAELGTALISDLESLTAEVVPALVESGSPGGGQSVRHAFMSTSMTIGRPGFRNSIEIEDHCLAATHATVTRDAAGLWQMEAHPSLNGLWVKIEAVRLIDNCLFHCGEQRFRFYL